MKKMMKKAIAMAVMTAMAASIAACGKKTTPEAAEICKTETDHNWVSQTKTIHHDSKGHFEEIRQENGETAMVWVTDQDAYDEEVSGGYACSICGLEK